MKSDRLSTDILDFNHGRHTNHPLSENKKYIFFILLSLITMMILQFRSEGYIELINRKVRDKPVTFTITGQIMIPDHHRPRGNEEREKQKEA
jgi:hypothetical protein